MQALAEAASSNSAGELLKQASRGGVEGLQALRLFGHVEDAYAFRGRLCALIPQVAPEWRGEVVQAVQLTLDGQRVFGETLFAENDAQCRAALARVIEDPATEPPVKQLAHWSLAQLNTDR